MSSFRFSLKQLQQPNDKVDEIALALYSKILDEIGSLGARVVKIMFKPSSDSTARLMENGDFRVKFRDGIFSKPYSSISFLICVFRHMLYKASLNTRR